VTELTAAHSLSEKIKQALEKSSFLIVLCSPTAKESHWVNEEIRLFRDLHGDRNILSAIVEGAPSTAFPPALLENGHEPLAANLKQGRDSFRFGVHQLAASIMGVGLDTLVQRGERKRRLRTQIAATAATGLAVVMGGLWFNAQNAQKQAEKSRDDAERLVEYMVSDLKGELYSLQRLDILDGLGEEIVNYYEGIDPERLPDERLVKLITALQTLAEVSNLERSFDRSERYLEDASRLIDVLEKRNPQGINSVFYRAQNEYWTGQIYLFQGEFDRSLKFYENYDRLGQLLYKQDPTNKQWIMEAGWGKNNLGMLYRNMGKLDLAANQYGNAIEIFEKAYQQNTNDVFISYEFANVIAGASYVESLKGNKIKATEYLKRELQIYDNVLNDKNENYKAHHYRNIAYAQLLRLTGHTDCNSAELEIAAEEAKRLHLHEPKNSKWRREHLYFQFARIEDCKNNFPGRISVNEINSFLKKMTMPENKEFFLEFEIPIKKLQAD